VAKRARRLARRMLRHGAPVPAFAGGLAAMPPPPFGPFMGMGMGMGGPLGHRARRRGRGRMRRGAIRTAILAVLVDQPMHGYEIMNQLSERSGGRWRPSPGSVYPTLQQLEDEDLVRADDVDGKKVFRLTDAGKAEATKVADDGAPWEALDEDVSDGERSLYQSAMQVGVAATQVAQAGTPEQIAAAQAALDEARKKIYRLLAEDAPSDAD
jgi:DNA-binding PadR family transcriptional regulator